VAAASNTGQTAAQAKTQMRELNAAMAELSPPARQAVAIFGGQLLPAFEQFEKLDSAALFGSMMPFLQSLTGLFRDIEPYILQAATGIGQTASELAKWGQQAGTLREIDNILASGNKFMSTMGDALEKWIKGFTNLGSQGVPLLRSFGQSIDNVASAFLRWTSDGKSLAFIATIEKDLPAVKRFVDELMHSVIDIAKAWSNWGISELSLLSDGLRLLDWLAKTNPQLIDLVTVGYGLAKVWGVVAAVAGSDLIGALGAAGAGFLGLGRDALTAEGETITAFSGIDLAIGSTGVGLVLIGLGIAVSLLMQHWQACLATMKDATFTVANAIINGLNVIISALNLAFAALEHLANGVIRVLDVLPGVNIGTIKISGDAIKLIPHVTDTQGPTGAGGSSTYTGPLTWSKGDKPKMPTIPTAVDPGSLYAAQVAGTAAAGATAAALQKLAQTLAIQQLNALAVMQTDTANAMNTFVSDTSKIFSDGMSSLVSKITDTATVAASQSAAAAQAIADQSKITVDTLAERGLYGVALQAAQGQVALDKLTAKYDAQIAADSTKNDRLTLQQDALVGKAQTKLDEVTRSTDTAVAKAQLAYDLAMTGSNKIWQAQAAESLAAVKATQQTQVTAAQASLARAQSTASVLEAQAAAALQSVQTAATLSEQREQAILDKLNAESKSGAMQVTFIMGQTTDPHALADAAMFQLRLAGYGA
jgi:hypothetical protein